MILLPPPAGPLTYYYYITSKMDGPTIPRKPLRATSEIWRAKLLEVFEDVAAQYYDRH